MNIYYDKKTTIKTEVKELKKEVKNSIAEVPEISSFASQLPHEVRQLRQD